MGRVLKRLTLAVALGVVGYVVWLDIDLRRQFDGSRWSLPAHLYSRVLEIRAMRPLTPERLVAALAERGYRPDPVVRQPGTFHAQGESVRLVTRPFAYWDGHRPAVAASVRFDAGRVRTLTDSVSGQPIPALRIDPLLLGSITPTRHEDRVLVSLHQAPEELLTALLVMEDRRFMEHWGIDLRGLGRALLANLRSGEVVQGGSTLTQQLVKNMYLDPRRSIGRKINESIMAVLLEAHYDKGEILEAYLNEVFLAQAGRRAIHGFGLASEYYFGRPLAELNLHESALLAGMVKAPSAFEPRRNPREALQRRNLVIDELARLGHIDPETARQGKMRPLGVSDRPGASRTRDGYVELVRRQLQSEYREAELRADGVTVFTGLDPGIQQAAQTVLREGLGKLEKHHAQASGTLQGAILVTDVGSGDLLALVGGRDADNQSFNRALDAVRPIGSLVKPAVYLAALRVPERYGLTTLLRDDPLRVPQPNAPDWEPQNYDRVFRGNVTLLAALAQSYNVPAVRLGLELGVPKVTDTLDELGVRRTLHGYPSLLLGAVDLSPLEVMQMYQTIAAGGVGRPLRAVVAVTDNSHGWVTPRRIVRERRIDSRAMYLLVYALQEVVRSGTAAALADRFDAGLALAGKTGTTNGYRDSWFAGFSGNYAAVVWVGRDDNQPAGLTGAAGAMHVWADLMARLDLEAVNFTAPADVSFVDVDPASGAPLGAGCPRAVAVPFAKGYAPPAKASCAGSGSAARDPSPDGADGRTLDGARGWFRRLFGGGRDSGAPPQPRDDQEKAR